MDFHNKVLAKCQELGIDGSKFQFILDDKFVPLPRVGKPASDTGGRYKCYLSDGNQIKVVILWNFERQQKATVFDVDENTSKDTILDLNLADKKWNVEAEKLEYAEAAKRAKELYDSIPTSNEGFDVLDKHPYIVNKGIEGIDGFKIFDGKFNGVYNKEHLLIPIKDIDDNIMSLQSIFWSEKDKQFQKRFLKGGKKSGGFFKIAKGDSGVLLLAEGIATAVSIAEACNFEHQVYCCFDAGNLEHVAKALRAKHPSHKIVICADNDYKEGNQQNPGIEAANKAAQAVNGLVAVPYLINGKKTDFNDIATQYRNSVEGISKGRSEVRQIIDDVINSKFTDQNDVSWELVPKPELPPFHVFADPIQKIIAEMQVVFGTNFCIFASWLTFFAVIFNGRYSTQITGKRKQYGNEFIVLVGESGIGKTDPATFMLKPVKDYFNKQYKHWEVKEGEKAKELNDIKYKINNKIIDKNSVDLSKFEPVPPPNRMIGYDFTIEGLNDQLANKPPVFSIIGDELLTIASKMQINISSKVKKNSEGALDSSFLSLWDGTDWGSIRTNSNKARNHSIPFATITLFGGIQPSKFTKFFSTDDMDSGLLGRCVVIRESTTDDVDDFNLKGMSQESVETIRDLAKYYLDRECSYNPETDELIPTFIPFTNDAEVRFREWYREKKKDAKAQGRTGLLSKISMHTTRFALWLYLTDRYFGITDKPIITTNIIDRAITYGNWLYRETFIVWDLLESKNNSEYKLVDLSIQDQNILNTIFSVVDNGAVSFTSREVAEKLGATSKGTVTKVGRAINNLNTRLGNPFEYKRKTGGGHCFIIIDQRFATVREKYQKR